MAKEKIDTLSLIKLKTLAFQKTLIRLERQAMDSEKIFACYIFDKELSPGYFFNSQNSIRK